MVPGAVEIRARVVLHADNRAAWLALRWSSDPGVPAFFSDNEGRRQHNYEGRI